MKTNGFGFQLALTITLIMSAGFAQADYTCRSSALIGQQAPPFTAKAIIDGEIKDISLSDYEGKNKILIFYPADFSFICPTELFAFQEKQKEFADRNAVLIAISVDQVYAHQKWLEIPRDQGGIKGIAYPIVSDINKTISHEYGVLNEKEGIDFRGVFVIDSDNIVQAVAIYNDSIGRDISEVLRVLDAVLFTKEHGHVCPANWAKGQKGMEATQDGLKEYLKENSKKEEVQK